MANTANFKYITMSIQVGEDYTDVLKTLGPLLNCARDWSQQIFFCGLIGPESECFFWLGRPFLAQERMQADESIRQFVAQTNSTRKSLLEKLYIVDYQGRLSFVQMV